jgi:hypothetical protein
MKGGKLLSGIGPLDGYDQESSSSENFFAPYSKRGAA